MEVKARILKTAEELFFKHGVRSVTMDDIAHELGISKKTIYQHFEDKDAIVYEGTLYSFECDRGDFEKIHQEATNPIDEIFRMSEYMRQNLTDIHPSVLFDFKKYYPKAWQLFQEHKQTYMKDNFRQNLEAGIEQGLYRLDIDVELLARMRMEVIELAFNTIVFPRDKFNIIDVQLKFTDLFLRGILTEKGLQLYNEYKIV